MFCLLMFVQISWGCARDDDDQNPSEFMWILTMMIRIPMNPMVFIDDDHNPYEFIWFLKMVIRIPMKHA